MIIRKKKLTPDQIKAKMQEAQEEKIEPQEEFDFSNIKFEEREERRKGNRRRGYRRIDDRNLVSRAQEEAISIRENAVKQGYEQGLREAHEEIYLIKESMSEFFQYKDKILEIVSKDVMDIALDISQKIIKKEACIDKSVVLNLIVDIFNNNISKENKVTIKVGSDDIEYLKDKADEIVKLTQTDAKIHIMEDSNIVGGGVIIETTNGIVDASFKTQFELLKEALKKI